MKGKQLLILACIATVLIAAAIKSSQPKTDPYVDLIGGNILKDIDVNSVDTVVISGASSTTTVERGEHGWTIKEKYGYPADFEKVRSTVVDLADLKVADVIDIAPEDHPRLGLGEPSADVDSKRIALKQGSTVLAELILGKAHTKHSATSQGYGGYPDGRFLKTADGEHIFRVANALTSLTDKPVDWVESDLINVSSADVETLSITGTDRPPLMLKRAGTGLSLADLADDEEMQQSQLSTLGNVLSYLTLRDVADPGLNDETMGFTQPVELKAATKNGTHYTALLGGLAESEGRYVRIRVD
ncbi:MAG: DUF4340 domain-containing protein, partial [Verrucomicrobia bacterium]|nr:DUF4340 domain-containing protein [Verrucomicrobiota bacterium]